VTADAGGLRVATAGPAEVRARLIRVIRVISAVLRDVGRWPNPPTAPPPAPWRTWRGPASPRRQTISTYADVFVCRTKSGSDDRCTEADRDSWVKTIVKWVAAMSGMVQHITHPEGSAFAQPRNA